MITTLYSYLTYLDKMMIFESNFTNVIDNGDVLVNNKKPDDINMSLYENDILTFRSKEYVVK